MTLRSFLGLCLALLFNLWCAPAFAQQTIKLTVASAQAPVLIWIKHIRETFIPAVDADLAKTGKYKIAWNEVYGGTLAKVGSELETMQQGISDMGIVTTVFHSAKMPLNNVTYFVPYGPENAQLVADAVDKVQALPEMTAEWRRYNIVYLAGFAFDSYAIFANFPLTRLEDLKGRKIGAGGANLSWLHNTGATGVQTSLSTAYNDAKSGVFDGVITFVTAAVPVKLFEVTPTLVDTKMGSMFGGGLAINRNQWDALPEEVRAAFPRAAAAYRAAFFQEQSARISAARTAWTQSGGKIIELSPAEQARFARAIPNLTKDWIKQAGDPAKKVLSAYMDEVRKTGYRFHRDVDKE